MIQINPRDAREWTPFVPDGDAPYYLRLADAMQRDIRQGVLTVGARLPTQRALARTLRVSVGTVNAAYHEATVRGLIVSHVGRGTFVASPGRRERSPSGEINLAVNQPPYHVAAPLIRKLLSQLIEDADTADLLGYPMQQDSGRYTTAVSRWLARTSRLPLVKPDELTPCHGATQALLATLELVAPPGSRILVETVTYAGFKVGARQVGAQLVAVEQDGEGMVPDALEQAVRTSGARVMLVCPTLQNPTGAVASLDRRRAWVRIARRHGLTIVEDDVYGALADDVEVVPLATLAPDITFHIGSASKSIAPGLRAGWVVAPRAHRAALASVVHRRNAMAAPYGCPVVTAGASPFGCLAFAKLCETRMADEILALNREEAGARLALAQAILGERMTTPGSRRSLHAWLPLDPLQAESLVEALRLQAIRINAPSAPMVEASPRGVRICLGGPERREQLEEALHLIAGQLARVAGYPDWHP